MGETGSDTGHHVHLLSGLPDSGHGGDGVRHGTSRSSAGWPAGQRTWGRRGQTRDITFICWVACRTADMGETGLDTGHHVHLLGGLPDSGHGGDGVRHGTSRSSAEWPAGQRTWGRRGQTRDITFICWVACRTADMGETGSDTGHHVHLLGGLPDSGHGGDGVRHGTPRSSAGWPAGQRTWGRRGQTRDITFICWVACRTADMGETGSDTVRNR